MKWFGLKKIKGLLTKGVSMDYESPSFDPESYSTNERMKLLEAKVEFLQDEVSGLRRRLRWSDAGKIGELPLSQQTRESFDFQWRSLPEGHAMLSSGEWKEGVTDTICTFSDLPAEWFKGKKAMDAGCGQGRWTYGFGKLGVGSCTSFDVSEHGLERTREITKEFSSGFTVSKKNILEDLEVSSDFDLVWCFGVLHHTGDTYRGFQNLVKCVKPGGYLFLMIYGEPRRNDRGDYEYYHDVFDMRCRLRNLPFQEKIKRVEEKYGKKYLHGYFDAISPEINDLYRWDELVGWLIAAGFEDIKRTLPDHPNHHVVARKKTV